MSFEPQKLGTFSKKIIDLADQPNMQPHELKEYFDSSPEELRQSHNGLCDALTAKTAASALGFSRTAGVPADTVQAAVENVQQQLDAAVMGNIPSGSVTGDKLAQDVRDRLTAIESAAAAEAAHCIKMQEQLDTHTTQIAAKCEVYVGIFTGDGTKERTISLDFTPKAILLMNQLGQTIYTYSGIRWFYGGLCLQNHPVCYTENGQGNNILSIKANGFQVYETSIPETYDQVKTNTKDTIYIYIAFC